MKLFEQVLVLLALLASAPLIHAQAGRGHAPTGGGHAPVARENHGSIRHADVGAFRHEPMEAHRVVINRGPNVHREIEVHRHIDVNVGHPRHFRRAFFIGSVVSVLPVGYATIYVGSLPYYYWNGIYYRPAPAGYVAVMPPVGAAVAALPPDAFPVAYDGQVLYYADGVFYQQEDSNFIVVPAPIGVVVPSLPEGTSQAVVNGMVYFQYNGVYYKPAIVNGVTQYITAIP